MELIDQKIKKENLCILCLSEGAHFHHYEESTPEYLKFILDNTGFKKKEKFCLCSTCEKGNYC